MKFEDYLTSNKILIITSFIMCIITVLWSLLSVFTTLVPHGIFNFTPIVTVSIALICMIISLTHELIRFYRK